VRCGKRRPNTCCATKVAVRLPSSCWCKTCSQLIHLPLTVLQACAILQHAPRCNRLTGSYAARRVGPPGAKCQMELRDRAGGCGREPCVIRTLLGSEPALFCVRIGWSPEEVGTKAIDDTARAIATDLTLGAYSGGSGRGYSHHAVLVHRVRML